MPAERARPRAIVYLHTHLLHGDTASALALQERAARRWAEVNDFEVYKVVADITDRAHLPEVLTDVADGRAQAVAIFSSQTLAGAARTAVMHAVRNAGGTLLSAQEKTAASEFADRF
jgi:hypothetical protein